MNRKVYQEIAIKLNAIDNCKKNNNIEWLEKHESDIRSLDDLLPRGSGFNRGSFIDIKVSREDKIIIQSGFHVMDSNGYYDHWIDFNIIVTPSLAFNFNLDITHDNWNDQDIQFLEDYIVECFYTALTTTIKKNKTGYTIVK